MEGPATHGLPGSSGSPSSVMTGMAESSGDESTIPISGDSAEVQSGGARTLLTVLQGWNNGQDRYRRKNSAGLVTALGCRTGKYHNTKASLTSLCETVYYCFDDEGNPSKCSSVFIFLYWNTLRKRACYGNRNNREVT